jgi:hypothetical protein
VIDNAGNPAHRSPVPFGQPIACSAVIESGILFAAQRVALIKHQGRYPAGLFVIEREGKSYEFTELPGGRDLADMNGHIFLLEGELGV